MSEVSLSPTTPAAETVNVLAVEMDCVGLPRILSQVEEWAGQPGPRTIFYANAHGLNTASSDPVYRAALNQADLVYADGVGIVWASRLLGGHGMEKATGADWIEVFARLAELRGWRIYILAGKPGIACAARAALVAKYPALRIVGVSDGFFAAKSEGEVIQEIRQVRPHVLFVGMGLPRQEKWIAAHRDALGVSVSWGVGALFDYVAGVEPRAPGWMRAVALEWLWRLLVDPVGKWRRYVLGNPVFLYRVLRQRWGRSARR